MYAVLTSSYDEWTNRRSNGERFLAAAAADVKRRQKEADDKKDKSTSEQTLRCLVPIYTTVIIFTNTLSRCPWGSQLKPGHAAVLLLPLLTVTKLCVSENHELKNVLKLFICLFTLLSNVSPINSLWFRLWTLRLLHPLPTVTVRIDTWLFTWLPLLLASDHAIYDVRVHGITIQVHKLREIQEANCLLGEVGLVGQWHNLSGGTFNHTVTCHLLRYVMQIGAGARCKVYTDA